MFNVFADMHHASLLNSLIILFEHRLGGMVYRPIGHEWFDRGFWAVYMHPQTVEQFLGIGGATPDGTDPVNEVVGREGPFVYQCHDIDSGQFNRAITFEGFTQMPFDYVIATIPDHVEPFKRLVREYQPNAKMIYQIGNSWTIAAASAPNIMASAVINGIPDDINFISYHQEFDTNLFRPQTSTQDKTINAFINCYNGQEHFSGDWHLFEFLSKLMPEWQWRSYGGQCRDGCMHGSQQLAQGIAGSRFVWHVKTMGDGYGHIIHNAFAMGVPPIVRMSDYDGKLARPLMVDGVTCIAIDGLAACDIANKIEYFNENTRYESMRQNAYNVFKQVVDFDLEANRIRHFLEVAK